jgi:hypothetical protein
MFESNCEVLNIQLSILFLIEGFLYIVEVVEVDYHYFFLKPEKSIKNKNTAVRFTEIKTYTF